MYVCEFFRIPVKIKLRSLLPTKLATRPSQTIHKRICLIVVDNVTLRNSAKPCSSVIVEYGLLITTSRGWKTSGLAPTLLNSEDSLEAEVNTHILPWIPILLESITFTCSNGNGYPVIIRGGSPLRP